MKKICIVLAYLVSVIGVHAQKTDISGNWVLKDKKSISGNLYGNAFPEQITVSRSANQLTLTTSTDEKLFPADIVGSETNTLDGKVKDTIVGQKKRRKTVSVMQDKEGKKYIRTSSIYQEDGQSIFVTYTDSFVIDDDQLILQRKAENFTNGEVWEAKGIYKKQG